MAQRIIDAGFATSLFARRPATLEPFAGSAASVVGSLAELGRASDVLGVCVVDDAAVDQVLRGPDGALASMAEGSIVLIHSTVHPDTCKRLQADHPHLDVLDAPVSGGGHMAAVGQLVVMIGGPGAVLERCRPVLDTFGDPVLHLGELGAGQEAKVINNTVFAAQLALAADVYTLAAERGLSQHALATILAKGSGRSYAAEVVAGGGFDVARVAALAGPLLAKDVGILVEIAGLHDQLLVEAADAALDKMGVSRQNP